MICLILEAKFCDDYLLTELDVANTFSIRFVEVEVLQKEVTRLVHSNPLAVCQEPKALQFLVDEETIKQNKPELVHVLVWATVPPVTAISFFSQQFPPHPVTAQYAVRCLQSYQPVS